MWRITTIWHCVPLPNMLLWLWIIHSHRVLNHQLPGIHVCNIHDISFACPVNLSRRLLDHGLQRIIIRHFHDFDPTRNIAFNISNHLQYDQFPRIHLCYFKYLDRSIHALHRPKRHRGDNHRHCHHYRLWRIHCNLYPDKDIFKHHDNNYVYSHSIC